MRDNCPKCGTALKKYKESDGKLSYNCQACEITGTGTTPDEAWKEFCNKLGVPEVKPVEEKIETAAIVPVNKETFMPYIEQHKKNAISNLSGIMQKSAVEKLLDTNTAYIMNEKMLAKLWNTEEGVQSLTDAFNEALSMAAELPRLGSILPFGDTAVFIPRVEAYRTVLCNGSNAPFQWINIDVIREKDKITCRRVNGSFELIFDNISTFDRGEIKSIAVYGLYKAQGQVIGEIYDAQRILEKGTASSPSYRKYLEEVALFKKAQSEGKTKIDENGDEYYIKTISYYSKKDKANKIFEKEVYLVDLTNPYDGPHKEEMLKKVAGKCFLNPYLKERLGAAVINDMEGIMHSAEVIEEQTAPQVAADMAEKQFIVDETEVIGTEETK